MAIRAQKGAFACLGAGRLDRPRYTALRQAEGLLARLQVVELESRYAAVIATDHAATAGLGDEHVFDPPTPPRHRVAPTLKAAVATGVVAQDVTGDAVNSAGEVDVALAAVDTRTSICAPRFVEVVLL
jgi:hypothetical protein